MGFKSIVKKGVDPLNLSGRGQNMLFGDQAGQAAEAARLTEQLKAQQDKARADLMGVLNQRPEYKSILGGDFQKERDYAFGNESSPGFLLQRQREDQNLQDALQAQTQTGLGQTANAYSQLAMNGGLSSGARERIAQQSANQGILARQQLRGQNARNLMDLGINEEGQRLQSRAGVLQAQMQDATNSNNFAQESWKTRANTLAGLSQAESQQSAALANRAKDNGMCCFIFLEARYGDGTMDAVVRKYRDEFVTARNKRGYYKLAEVIVPMMRKSRTIKALVRLTMTDPLVSYGKWHYTKMGFGWIFKPVKDFWLRTFDFLGQDTQFVRENGEVV